MIEKLTGRQKYNDVLRVKTEKKKNPRQRQRQPNAACNNPTHISQGRQRKKAKPDLRHSARNYH
jgi:hypothetical protein